MLINNYTEETLTLASEIIAGRQQTIEQIIVDSFCKEIEKCTIGEIVHFLETKQELYFNFIER